MKNIEGIYPINPIHVYLLADGHGANIIEARRYALGKPDRARLTEIWNRLIDATPMLRTAFMWEDIERPVQVVYKAVSAQLGHLAHLGVSITEPPLVDCSVAANNRGYVITLRAATILLDELSLNLILDTVVAELENSSQYRILREPAECTAPLCSPVPEATNRLLPNHDRPILLAPHIPDRRMHLRRRTIPIQNRVAAGLRQWASKLGVPNEALLLATWVLLQFRLSTQADVFNGLEIDYRPTDGLDWIGPLRLTVPFQAHVKQSDTLEDLVKQCATFCAAVRRTPSIAPMPSDTETAIGWIDESVPKTLRFRATAPLSIRFRSQTNGAILEAIYEWPRIPKVQVAEILHLFSHLLERAPTFCQTPMRSVSLLDGKLRNRIVAMGCSRRQPADVAGESVVSAFEDQCQKNPSAECVAFPEGVLSYAHVNAHANQLAHRIQNGGTKPESIIAILLEPSPERIIAQLAVLKAGCAFLPVDPTLPPSRIRMLLDNSDAQLLITDPVLLSGKIGTRLPYVYPSAAGDSVAKESELSFPYNIRPHSLAYLIYTSGSAGEPKGVLIEHRGLLNTAISQARRFGPHATQRVLQFASSSFDASISEVFATLICGGTLCLPDKDVLQVGAALRDTLSRMRITQVTLPPSALRTLHPEGLPDLFSVVSAGEPCTPELVERWTRPGLEFWNAYGPTEVTVCASMTRLRPGDLIHIGLPLDGTRLYILNDSLEPVTFGVTGELYVAGPGVARGYRGRTALTAERFLPDPFSRIPGERMYRTGDHAVRDRDGYVRFVGRTDRQVKVRGFRVELEEIEDALLRHPQIQHAAVTLRSDGSEPRLTAYIVLAPGNRRIEIWPSTAEHFIYDDVLYQAMINDSGRMDAYRRGIRGNVTGKCVVDIGTGPDAVLARMCVDEGASKVYAVELQESVAARAEATVRRLGLSDLIVILHGDARSLTLPERANVCVSGLVGPVGGMEGGWEILRSARKLLAPEAKFVPSRSVTRIGAVSISGGASRALFSTTSAHYAKRILDTEGNDYKLRLCMKGLTTADIVSSDDIFEDLDFRIDHPYNWTRTVSLVMQKAAKVDGLLLWLTLYTGEKEPIDILATQHCWLPVFLPTFWPAVDLERGDEIRAECSGVISANGVNPDYEVRGGVFRNGHNILPFRYLSPHHATGLRDDGFCSAVIPDGEPQVEHGSSSTWKHYLANHLPSYMIPADYIVLDSMPFTASGKVDYLQLPTAAPAVPTSTLAQPETPEEEMLAVIWSAVLPDRTFGVTDNFFDVGGTSLLAAEVHFHLCSRMSMEVPLVDILKYPTIRNLAKHLSANNVNHTLAAEQLLAGDRLRAGREALLVRATQRRLN